MQGVEAGAAGGFSNPFTLRDEARPFSSGRALRPGELLPESILWSYVIQLSSVVRYVHTLGLACRFDFEVQFHCNVCNILVQYIVHCSYIYNLRTVDTVCKY